MPYTITGSVTYASQVNRDAAIARVNTAMTGQPYINYTTVLPAGITTSGTTIINVSIEVTDNNSSTAAVQMKLILDALVASNRHTLGYLSVNKT